MELRLPFFIAACGCVLLALLIELAAAQALTSMFAGETETPGHAIQALALIDGILLYSLIWMLLSVVVPRSVTGRAQGCITLVVSFFGCLGSIVAIYVAFALLMLMLALLVAVPFGRTLPASVAQGFRRKVTWDIVCPAARKNCGGIRSVPRRKMDVLR